MFPIGEPADFPKKNFKAAVTFAYFSDKAETKNTFVSGTLDLGVNQNLVVNVKATLNQAMKCTVNSPLKTMGH
jgi:Camelysin metallo-endopeptidase